MRPEFTPKIVARFWSYVDQSGDPDACWPWMAGRDADGYGRFRVGARTIRSHRIAFFLNAGQWAEPMTLHTCDNPPCCNPAHLYGGTNIDNVRDKVQRGRAAVGERNGSVLHPERLARGERHGSRLHPQRVARGDRNGARTHPETRARGTANAKAVLTEEKVREIRRLHSDGWSNARVANHFGVGKFTIWNVVHRKTWAHIE